MSSLDTIVPQRVALAGALDQIARTPILRGKFRKFFSYTFPDLSLNQQEYNSVVTKFPADAMFLARKLFMTWDTGVNAFTTTLAKARFSTSSGLRSNQGFSNDLISFENMGAIYGNKVPKMFYLPTAIMPGSFMTLEAQNLDTITHIFKPNFEGELIYAPDAETLKFFASYSWFQYVAPVVTVDITAVPTTFTEIRTHPDADFYITNFWCNASPPSDPTSGIGGQLGPIRTKIYLGSQGEPIMDDVVNNVNLFGVTLPPNNTGFFSLASHAAMPPAIPFPIRVPAGASLFIQANQPAAGAVGTIEMVFEGIKVFI